MIQGDIASPEVQAGIERVRELLAADDAFSRPRDLEVSLGGDVALFAVAVAGETAFNIESFDIAARSAFVVFPFVLGISCLLLTVVFRSVLLPIKAIILNLLALGAPYGILVLVFQHGFLAGTFGFQESPIIEAWMPLFPFTILFGLSMDYHVFLLSRIRGRFDETQDNTESVAFGIRSTGRLITGAALIMVAVFWRFAAGTLVGLQQMGFGLGIAERNHRPESDGARLHEAPGQVEMVPARLVGVDTQRAVCSGGAGPGTFGSRRLRFLSMWWFRRGGPSIGAAVLLSSPIVASGRRTGYNMPRLKVRETA